MSPYPRVAFPAYHSAFNNLGAPEVCGLAITPLKTRIRGPAPMLDPAERKDEEDCVDEAIKLFRANVLFRNFEIAGGGDRTLIYLTLFIHQCLKKVEKIATKAEASRVLSALASVLPATKSAAETDSLRQLMKQLRETLAPRLLDRIYNADGTPNKFWMMFSKRKFLNKEFV